MSDQCFDNCIVIFGMHTDRVMVEMPVDDKLEQTS